MHNAIAWANYETRRALHQSREMNKLLERDPDFISESAGRRIKSAAENVVRHLLMCDEYPLSSKVSGTSGFQKAFESQGIRDSEGRSLRKLDLRQRVFRYPCSFLIYSAAFEALPDEARTQILRRLLQVLEGADPEEFKHLTVTMRRDIATILRSTKPEFKRTSANPPLQN